MDITLKPADIDKVVDTLHRLQDSLTQMMAADKDFDFSEEVRALEYAAHNLTTWIPVSKKLPREKINPVTNDYYEYPCIYKNGDVYDTRHYKYGKGHWWNWGTIMDDYVTAWMPLPEYYKGEPG